MPNALYQHTCSACSKSYIRQEPWIDPKVYTNPEKAFKTVTFWCPKCREGQAVQFLMRPNNTIEVIEVLNYKDLCAGHAPAYYSSFSDDEETDNEDIAVLSEKKAFFLLDLD